MEQWNLIEDLSGLIAARDNGTGKAFHVRGNMFSYYSDEEEMSFRSVPVGSSKEALIAILWTNANQRMEDVTEGPTRAAMVLAWALQGSVESAQAVDWIRTNLWGKESAPAVGSYYDRKAKILAGETVSLSFTDLIPPYTFGQLNALQP